MISGMNEEQERHEFIVLLKVASAVAFEGTYIEAQDHANRYAAHLQMIFEREGLQFKRLEHAIRRRETQVPQLDTTQG